MTAANRQRWDQDTCDSEKVFDESQLEAYRRDGFIQVSGLLPSALVEEMSEAGRFISAHSRRLFPNYFSVVERGLIFDGGISGLLRSEIDLPYHGETVFREAALLSKLPQAAAELMQLDRSTQSVRVLR